MEYFGNCLFCGHECSSCGRSKCGPAAYDCDVSLTVDPYNDDIWNLSLCGKLFQLHAPQSKETDTSLSTNYSNASLFYVAEKHTDIISGEQLGQLIRIEDLRDTDCDYTTSSMCYELIYRKYGECGEGCKSAQNGWVTFSIDNQNAKQDWLHYVRGVNVYGCPIFLDEPATPTEWYWTGWRTEGIHNEFGYFQPRKVSSRNFPKDANGNHIFITEDPNTREPLSSTLPLDCILNNLLGNLGMKVTSEWSVIQQTAGFGATFNNMTGDFVIKWSDWNGAAGNPALHAGDGQITGQLAWTISADAYTGKIVVHITSVNFYSAKWTKDLGVQASTMPTLNLSGVNLDTGALTKVLTKTYGNASWSETLNTSIPCNVTLTIKPGKQPLEPTNFCYIFVDWIGDDEGYLGAKFSPMLSGWVDCFED